jgi:hypothetical protein
MANKPKKSKKSEATEAEKPEAEPEESVEAAVGALRRAHSLFAWVFIFLLILTLIGAIGGTFVLNGNLADSGARIAVLEAVIERLDGSMVRMQDQSAQTSAAMEILRQDTVQIKSQLNRISQFLPDAVNPAARGSDQ